MEGRWIGSLARTSARVLIPLSLVVVAALTAAYAADIPVTDLLRDPAAVLDAPWYVGAFSTIGVGLWISAGAACTLVLLALGVGDSTRLVLAGSVSSLILGIDDGLLIHEFLNFDLGVPPPVTFLVYGGFVLPLFWRARRQLVGTPDLAVFLLAVALLATSLGLDLAGELGLPTPPLSAILEDVTKLLGIATWLSFFGSLSLRTLEAELGRQPQPSDGSPSTVN